MEIAPLLPVKNRVEVQNKMIISRRECNHRRKEIKQEETPVPTPVTPENKTKKGAFEGAAYLTKGMYRPLFDCRMRTNTAPEFCPVCQQAVEKMRLFLTE